MCDYYYENCKFFKKKNTICLAMCHNWKKKKKIVILMKIYSELNKNNFYLMPDCKNTDFEKKQ